MIAGYARAAAQYEARLPDYYDAPDEEDEPEVTGCLEDFGCPCAVCVAEEAGDE